MYFHSECDTSHLVNAAKSLYKAVVRVQIRVLNRLKIIKGLTSSSTSSFERSLIPSFVDR